MRKQFVNLFTFLVGITLIISGVIFVFTKSFKDSKTQRLEEENILADEIGEVYKTFFDKEQNITRTSEELNQAIIEYASYYTNMTEGYSEIINKFNSYQDSVREVEDISSFLKEKCVNSYSVASANEKCNAYYINLERTINIFVGSIKYLNTKIDEYNEWTKTENESVGTTVKYEALDRYTSKYYNDYVDLNKDGTFLEMNND